MTSPSSEFRRKDRAPLTLLFAIPSLRAGGKERRLVELLGFLRAHSNCELYLVLTEDDIHYDYVSELGIPVTILKRFLLRKDPSMFWRFWREAKRIRPNLIHTWDGMTTFYAIPAARLLGVPLLNSEIANATERENTSSFDNFAWRVNRRFSTRILANSHAGLRAYGVSPEEGVVIHNGVRLERFQRVEETSEVKARFGIHAPQVIVMVASFTEKKDQGKFIEVARRVEATRPSVAFVAVGDGPTRDRFMRDVAERGPGNVIFTGEIKSVEALVSASDIGVLLTHGEGLPNSVIEYMALKKPVIATDAGGTNELVMHGKTGFLVDRRNDVEEIAARVVQLLDNAGLRQEMGQQGFDRIRDEFTIEKMGRSFLELYDSVSR